MYATEDYIRLVASGLSATAGVTVREGKNWMVDVKKKVLEYKLDDLKYRPFPVVRGFLLHEIGHLKYTSPLKSKTKLQKKYPHAMQTCYNTFEDVRIEGKLCVDYEDFASSAINSLHRYSSTSALQRRFKEKESPRLVQFLKLCLFHYLYEFFGIYDSRPDQFLPYVDPEVKDRFNKNLPLIQGMVEQSYHHTKGLKELQEMVDTKLYPIIKDFIEEFEKTAKRPAVIKLPIPSWLAGDEDSDQINDMNLPTRQEALALLNPYISTLSARLRDILLEKKAVKWRGIRLKGKLLSKNAYKVCVPDEKRIFSKKTTPDTPDYSVYIALDSSGSMQEMSRGVYASLAAYLLEEVCHRLKFKVHFYSFTATAERLKNASEYKVVDGGTMDYAALKLIKKDINFSDNNLVIFITDGDTMRTPPRKKMMNEFKRKKAKVYGIGIGDPHIKSSLEQSFETYVYVPQVSRLPLEMIQLLRKEIKR